MLGGRGVGGIMVEVCQEWQTCARLPALDSKTSAFRGPVPTRRRYMQGSPRPRRHGDRQLEVFDVRQLLFPESARAQLACHRAPGFGHTNR